MGDTLAAPGREFYFWLLSRGPSSQVWPIRRFALAKEFFRIPRNRLLAIWALVAFILANHEFAIRPIQPLHFDRGYIWIPLFLMGARSLGSLFKYFWYRLP